MPERTSRRLAQLPARVAAVDGFSQTPPTGVDMMRGTKPTPRTPIVHTTQATST